MARSVKYKFGQLNNRDDGLSLGYFADKRTQLISNMTEAVNVDVFDTESASRRDGYTSVNSSPGHSAFATLDGQEFYFVSDGNFCRLNPDFTVTALTPLFSDDRVWMRELNGLVLASNGTDVVLVDSGVIVDMPTPTEQHEVPFPASKYLSLLNGVVYGATAVGISRTKAYSLLSDERSSEIPLPNITMIAAVTDGLWVGTTEKVYWIGGGGDDEFTLVEKSQSGIVRGAYAGFNSSVVSGGSEKEPAIVMVSGEGVCVGRNGGALDNVSIDNISIGDWSSGCCYVREANGGVFFLVSLFGAGGANTFSGSEFITNEQNYS